MPLVSRLGFNLNNWNNHGSWAAGPALPVSDGPIDVCVLTDVAMWMRCGCGHGMWGRSVERSSGIGLGTRTWWPRTCMCNCGRAEPRDEGWGLSGGLGSCAIRRAQPRLSHAATRSKQRENDAAHGALPQASPAPVPNPTRTRIPQPPKTPIHGTLSRDPETHCSGAEHAHQGTVPYSTLWPRYCQHA